MAYAASIAARTYFVPCHLAIEIPYQVRLVQSFERVFSPKHDGQKLVALSLFALTL